MTEHTVITCLNVADHVIDHVIDHAQIMLLIMLWSGGYHALITWLIMHVADHALIT